MEKYEFPVDDFGAVGDGVTNDGYAISTAVDEALKMPREAQKHIIFSCEKEYRVTEVPESHKLNCLFSLNDTDNVFIDGKGAKLIFKGTVKLLHVTESRNFSLQGFVIDYSPKPFVIASVVSFDRAARTIDFAAETDAGLGDEAFFPPEWWFLFPNRSDIRYHYFIEKYEKTGDLQYRVVVHKNTADRINGISVGDEFLLPHCGGSHFAGGCCTITDCHDVTLSCLRFYSHPEFGFDIRSNSGKLLFDSIALKPCGGSREQLVSWRDCFHVKDNTDPVVFDNCYIGPIGDDAFNLSCVYLQVTAVGDDKRTIYAHPAEKGDTRVINPGDEFVAYDLSTGREIGRAYASEVLEGKQDVRFLSDRPLPLLGEGMQIAFYRFANPGFVVKNSYIEGTVRVRSSGTFENCRFNVFWVRVENETFVEGPIPRDVTFRDCVFTTPYASDAEIFHVGTLSTGGEPSYKCTGIVLDGCTFEKGIWQADDGNELILK